MLATFTITNYNLNAKRYYVEKANVKTTLKAKV